MRNKEQPYYAPKGNYHTQAQTGDRAAFLFLDKIDFPIQFDAAVLPPMPEITLIPLSQWPLEKPDVNTHPRRAGTQPVLRQERLKYAIMIHGGRGEGGRREEEDERKRKKGEERGGEGEERGGGRRGKGRGRGEGGEEGRGEGGGRGGEEGGRGGGGEGRGELRKKPHHITLHMDPRKHSHTGPDWRGTLPFP